MLLMTTACLFPYLLPHSPPRPCQGYFASASAALPVNNIMANFK